MIKFGVDGWRAWFIFVVVAVSLFVLVQPVYSADYRHEIRRWFSLAIRGNGSFFLSGDSESIGWIGEDINLHVGYYPIQKAGRQFFGLALDCSTAYAPYSNIVRFGFGIEHHAPYMTSSDSIPFRRGLFLYKNYFNSQEFVSLSFEYSSWMYLVTGGWVFELTQFNYKNMAVDEKLNARIYNYIGLELPFMY